MLHSLVELFQFCSLVENFPEEWRRGIIRPIHKDGDLENMDNYRGITITSNVYKLYSSVLESHVMQYAEEEDLFGDFQGAYRKGRRMEDNVFILKGVCSLRKRKKRPTCIGF